MIDSGFILIAREMLDHPVFANEPFCERLAWVWLIREAAWKDRTVRVGRAVVDHQRGACAASTRFLADRWQWSDSRVRRYLDRLQKQGLIVVKTDALTTQITICNYDKYQLDGRAADAEPTQDRRGADANKKELKELKEGNTGASVAAPKKRPFRLSEDWQCPPEWIEEAVAAGFTRAKALSEAERMKNWSLSSTSGAKLNWLAAWRNWYKGKLDDAKPTGTTKAELFGRM